MQTRINGTFVHNSYRGLVEQETDVQLFDVLTHAFPQGAIVQVDVTVSLIGQKPLCQERTKYDSTCRGVLEDDGSCPSVSTHKVQPHHATLEDPCTVPGCIGCPEPALA